jgi:hypothetical protein
VCVPKIMDADVEVEPSLLQGRQPHVRAKPVPRDAPGSQRRRAGSVRTCIDLTSTPAWCRAGSDSQPNWDR